MDLISVAILLFVVMDPLGNIPIFLAVLDKVAPDRRYKVLIRELLLALLLLLAFLYAGKYLLAFLGLSEAAIGVAGGIILFLIALKMIFPTPSSPRDDDDSLFDEPFLVPLAVPLIAGPSSMAVLLLLATAEPGRLGVWTLAVLLAWVVSAVILLLAPQLKRVLGQRGLIATERLMGMLLVAIAVQMFLEGVSRYLGLPTAA